MTIFGKFFKKYVKFLAIFLHSNGNYPDGQVHNTTRRGMISTTLSSNVSSTSHDNVTEIPSINMFINKFDTYNFIGLGGQCRVTSL